MQVFSKSPRQWKAAPLSPGTAAAFRQRVGDLGMGPVFTHTAYLINLGSTDETLRVKSVAALAEELRRAEALGAIAAITHTGTASDGAEAAAARIAAGVEAAISESGTTTVRLLLENTAGAGSTFGATPEELGAVLAALGVARERVGVCLDTCHAHAAGYDLAAADTIGRLLDEFESCCDGPVEALHANDCMFASGERRDRHAWIGEGTIGYGGFTALIAEPRLAGVPAITEMPGEPPEKDAVNVRRLVELRAEGAVSWSHV
jgi:deoxyribonuclease-4